MTPSERLLVARRALGLSTSEMAATLGLKGENAKDDFRKMEKGGREPSGPILVAAEALVRIRELEQQLGIELAHQGANEE